ncbi:general secretion pathway protein [Flavobacterium pallidum]|uniref:general secretion pathway protein n=1 Tax=Flavobacterium pallidum TaxID=2172098 RepID=UPI0011B24596|nr:general secretion pathway protein [Flavobacterium pallidum]
MAVFLLMLYISYEFSFANTIVNYRHYQENKKVIENDSYDPRLIKQLSIKEKQIDSWIADNNVAAPSFQNLLLRELNEYCDGLGLKIVDFQEPHEVIKKNIKTSSYIFSIEGSFNKALAFINKIENRNDLGVVKHLGSIKKTDYNSNRDFLISTIIIQKTSYSAIHDNDR